MLVPVEPKKNTATKGEASECAILARLIALGYKCLIPWGHDHRYDIAIDNDGEFVRIQCKTARYNKLRETVQFSTITTYARVGGKSHIRKGYRGKADYFGAYCPELGKVYLVPVEDAPKNVATLRLYATKNNQQKGICWAKDYEI